MSNPEKENSEEATQQEPKIVVDDDWKAQVAREKEMKPESQPPQPESEPPLSEEAAEEAEIQAAGKKGDELPPPPPATFDVLISMLFTQAMAMLGQLPDPTSGESQVNKAYAKHYIDTLDMLGQKTKGNLSDDEAKMLSEALHALRMTYVNVKKA